MTAATRSLEARRASVPSPFTPCVGDRQPERKKENKREGKEENARRSVATSDSGYERNRARSVPVSTVKELIVADPYKSGLSHFREIDKAHTLARGYHIERAQ